jgi:hypothetical protein
MKDLDNLIIRLQKGIDKKSAYIKTIRNPHLLIKSLKELNELIGNDSIKESVSKQISYLILEKCRDSESDVMLHTVLFGNAGVGKTLVSTKLAKIWYALGYLKGSQIKPKFNFDQFKPDQVEDQNMFNIFLFILLIWVIALTWNFYTSYGSLLTMVLIITLIFVVAVIYYNTTKNEPGKHVKHDSPQQYIEIKDQDIITVVSRDSLVGAYVGSTALKTKKLLEDNLGKVLFIDEAYSLMQSPEDSFGMEALTTLNLFMSEHPNEIIIIFAGYKDLLQSGVFASQPGLKRRFMWQFECEGYNASELYEIFKLKMDKKKWKIEDENEIKKLFIKHKLEFKNHGGDVDRLTFFSCLEHAEDYLENEEIGIKNLKASHVEKGIHRLVSNSIADTVEESTNPYANYMNIFKNKDKKGNDTFDNITFDDINDIKESLKLRK